MSKIRAAWGGSISFGMVNIPVKAYKSTDEKTVAFNQLHAACGGRIKAPKWCASCDVALEAEDIIRGYEISKGTYVRVTDADLDSVPMPTVKAIEIVRFVPASEIDPVTVNKSYYIGPDEVAGKAYELLHTALAKTGLVAIAKWTYSQKERLAVIRLYGDALSLQTLFWADEVREVPDVPHYTLSDQEVEMAVALVDAMKSDDANLSEFHDEYRDALLKVISDKAEGVEPTSAPATTQKPVADLMDALRASVEAAKAAKVA